MSEKTIHLVFKTHLDIGFTDHAARVRAQYHEQFIPQALNTAEHFLAEDPHNPKFIWTTGAWLIFDHLETQGPEKVARLERAIANGLIRWHALPFTTHTELMSPATFRAGLSMSQALDQRFGVTTTAAKMTDVPGHTLGIVPILARAGVNFLHLGVNTASPVPDVPPLFRWRAPDGGEILVMYQNSYGGTDFPLGSDIGLSFAHTNDNVGPQSVGQTVEAHRAMAHANPGVTIRASTLDAFGAQMWARRTDFPVIDFEIGDSWLHGAASDPIKLSRFRALQRLYDGFETEGLTPPRAAFGRGLAMVAEHTWGVDIKTYLRDDKAWDRPAFDAARTSDYRFAYTEASWAEQRAYLDAAVATLDPADRETAKTAIAATAPPPDRPITGTAITLAANGWSASLDPATGDITTITAPSGITIAAATGPLMAYTHESNDSAELQRHLDSYILHREDWAILDHDKPGLAAAPTARTAAFQTRLTAATGPTARLSLPGDAHDALGAPFHVDLTLESQGENHLLITYTLRQKPANRMPEAGFITFAPATNAPYQFEKMGLWLDAHRIAPRGGQLQAIAALRTRSGNTMLELTPLDCALVAPNGLDFMPFDPTPPNYARGVRFNLYNNKWGTNFPMWWEGDLMLRFVLELSASPAE